MGRKRKGQLQWDLGKQNNLTIHPLYNTNIQKHNIITTKKLSNYYKNIIFQKL